MDHVAPSSSDGLVRASLGAQCLARLLTHSQVDYKLEVNILLTPSSTMRSNEARARRAVAIYVGLCVLGSIPPLLVRSEAAASWLLIPSVLALPWTRFAGALIDANGLPGWSLIPLLIIGAAINAFALYMICGGRFRSPDV